METLDRLHPIKEELLSQRYYVRSLVRQACDRGLLTEEELSTVQMDLLLILARQADQWSRGESSSIPTEKARELMASILFVLGVQLKSYQTPEQAVDKLRSEPLNVLYENGLKLVRRKMAVSRHLQREILACLLDTPNVYYRSTVADGIDGFFKLYRPQFGAHEIHITADYPLCMGRPELEGIEFIEEYLRRFRAENGFCVCFSARDIHDLLCGLTADHRSIPLNMFEPVLLSALGLVICDKSPKGLDLTEDDRAFLYQVFTGRSETEVVACLKEALIRLDENMDLPRESMRYASLCIPKLAATIRNGVKLKTLDKVFLVPAYPEREPQIVLSYGDRMDDRAYQKLVEGITGADTSEEKVNLILSEVHALADLLDIVCDGELSAGDYALLIHRLPLPTVAILLSQYPNDDFLERESERLLYHALRERRSRLSPETQRQMEQMIKAIRREET